jgi:hypothetical protein
LVTGVAGFKVVITEITISNGSADNQLVTLRWGTASTVATATDYFPFYLTSDGGCIVLNLLGSESCMGVAGDGVYAVCSVGTNYIYPSIGYLLV